MAIKIRLTHFAETQIAANIENASMMEQIVVALAKKIHTRIKANFQTQWECFEEEAELLDDLALKFADVWIIGVANHTETYSATFAAPNLVGSDDLPQEDVIQKSKGFSGDVSGVIGETLFTVIAKRCFGLDENQFAHLRAHKGTGEQPDFAVYFPTQTFLEKFEDMGLTSTRTYPIPCEVKALSTTKLPPPAEIKERLRKAIAQLQNYWRVREITGVRVGVLCIVIRNPGKSYDVSMVWCN